MRDFVWHHPGVALAMQTLAACALGYISHLVQQHWYAENYLLLHISLWWTLMIVLVLHLADRPVSRARRPFERQRLEERLRLNAVFHADAAWHREQTSESLSDDVPEAGPLFRSICLCMPDSWRLQQLSMSIAEATQTASFGAPGGKRFELDFRPWGDAWVISLLSAKNVSTDDAQKFLLDLQQALEATDGISDIRWYDDADLEAELTTGEANTRGSQSPLRNDKPT